ncbi:2-oxoacid:acceptor oxidoreductase family protein [Candidatus Woesearchaeota archaeon]|nr:2-oxoacid:acceptor oxidoreductase family protein [Candidatus Woesearchaeota archaeon]
MFKLIIKGLGGQGAKTAVEILAVAANYEDKYFLAYPEFGPERTGTPISAYFKLDDYLIRDRSSIKIADSILVLSDKIERIDSELKKGGILILNSKKNHEKYLLVDADELSKEQGSVKNNIFMLGLLIKQTKILKKDSLIKAVKDKSKPEFLESNLKCLEAGYKYEKN